MKNNFLPFYILCSIFLWSCTNQQVLSEGEKEVTTRIAFGSCAEEDKAQPLLSVASGLEPDVFVYLGDNIYGDSRVMDTLRAKYAKLGAKEEFQQLVSQTRVLAVWDDHDFGENDAGRHYPFKEESKEIFMDFWKVPLDSERRQHKGIYGTELIKKEGHTIQIILLDTRTFRDNLLYRDTTDKRYKNDYMPNPNRDSTFLGEAQWKWLKQQLLVPADVRIIASSNQFSHAYNGWESWTNVPHEQQKMLDVIKATEASGVVFISGDVHWGEISRLEVDDAYPIYDVTSSGITETWDIIEPNSNRIGEAIPQNNIGLIEVITSNDTTQLRLAIYDITNKPVVEHAIKLSDIGF
jgi:alkaline phosphatase D